MSSTAERGEDHRRAERRARARVDRAEDRGRGVAGGVQPRDRRAVLAQHPAGRVGDQAALGAEVGEDEAGREVRRRVERGQRLVGSVAAGEERVVLVLAAVELLVDAGRGVAVEPLDRLDQRVRRKPGRRGQLARCVRGADPGAGLEVGGRVALGHRDRRQPAVLAGVEDVPGRDPLRRLGHLPAEPVVGQALVGVAATGLVDHQPAAEAEGERAAAVGLLEPGAEPAERPEVGGRTERDRRLDRLAGVGAARCHRPRGVARHVVLAAHRLVALEAAGGQQHAAAGADARPGPPATWRRRP